jgi:hypothetical protein
MHRLSLLFAALLGAGCVGIIDNEGMGADGGGSGVVTARTTGTGVVTNGTTSATSTTSSDPVPGTTGTTAGSGAGGASGAGSGGSAPDAGAGGSGGNSDAGVDGGGNASAPTFTQVKAIIQRNCGACHAAFTSYATFTTHQAGPCGGDTLASADDPANSAFLELVQGRCTILMPRGCTTAPCIAAADIQTVTAWINAGAPND